MRPNLGGGAYWEPWGVKIFMIIKNLYRVQVIKVKSYQRTSYHRKSAPPGFRVSPTLTWQFVREFRHYILSNDHDDTIMKFFQMYTISWSSRSIRREEKGGKEKPKSWSKQCLSARSYFFHKNYEGSIYK